MGERRHVRREPPFITDSFERRERQLEVAL
jgi:hypothetical protein